ncbi:MAG: glucose 1-dehydrogenase, partial [Nitrospinota bacterium]
MHHLFDLTGKVALVTGGGRGLGRGMALALAGAGADLVLVSRTASELEAVAAEARKLGRRALPVPLDLTVPGNIDRMVQAALEEFGKIDILVNNAGTNVRKPALEITAEEWERVVALNLRAAFFVAQAVGRTMIERRQGKIINTASLTSEIGIANVSVYGCTKGGIRQMTRALALEWAPYHINVNAIGPGYFKTSMTRAVFEDPERRRWIESRIPWGRTGTPDDLAGAVIFLAAPASDYI